LLAFSLYMSLNGHFWNCQTLRIPPAEAGISLGIIPPGLEDLLEKEKCQILLQFNLNSPKHVRLSI
jgi:hypothetical protein